MSITDSRLIAGRGFAVIVHGGAGDVAEENKQRHVEGARAAAERARALLESGGSALDAVELAVQALEDDPVFNAGTGACLTSAGTIELDASIMDGNGLRAGGVCALGPFKNPIAIARAVLDDGQHVLYAGAGADAFARSLGFAPVDPDSLMTEAAKRKLDAALRAGKPASWAGGTVGAVAIDRAGHIAAATSTGGTSAKRPGRVGDSPIPGAGNYADDLAGAVSATGHGEGILRVAFGAHVVALLRRGLDPEAAARDGIAALLSRVQASGGAIVVDRQARIGLARSTRTMTWAAAWEGGADSGA